MKRIVTLLLGATLFGVPTTIVSAQITPPSASATVRLESYRFASPDSVDLDKILLLPIPLSVRAILARNLELLVNGAFASATLTRGPGREATLSGPTDTEVRLTL